MSTHRTPLFSAALSWLLLCGANTQADHERPNILLDVADDMGWTELGCFGSEIDTPHLDALAHRGVKLTSFYTSVSCSPTRSMSLTGTENHIAGLGNMGEPPTPLAPTIWAAPHATRPRDSH